jgi:hypothetical protein
MSFCKRRCRQVEVVTAPIAMDLTKMLEDEEVGLLAECAEITDTHIRSLFKTKKPIDEPEITVNTNQLV